MLGVTILVGQGGIAHASDLPPPPPVPTPDCESDPCDTIAFYIHFDQAPFALSYLVPGDISYGDNDAYQLVHSSLTAIGRQFPSPVPPRRAAMTTLHLSPQFIVGADRCIDARQISTRSLLIASALSVKFNGPNEVALRKLLNTADGPITLKFVRDESTSRWSGSVVSPEHSYPGEGECYIKYHVTTNAIRNCLPTDWTPADVKQRFGGNVLPK